jgi:nucleotide-binding universal stress UspA family protein
MPDKQSGKPPAFSLKSILVPLDGSVFGEAALSCAEELARTSGAQAVLMQAVTPHHFEIDLAETRSPHLAGISEEYLQHATAAARSYLAGIQQRLSERGIAVRSVVETGQAAEAILACARNNAVDMIALSTRGRSGISALVMGSVANKVLHSAEVPVLLVKPRN